MDAPFDRSDCEIWAVNDCFVGLPRVDHIFEIHPFFQVDGTWYRRGKSEWRGWKVNDYLKALNDSGATSVFMQEINLLVKQSRAFPLVKILDLFPRKYFTSTIAYMLAYLISLDADEISLYGMNFAFNEEYYKQKPCIEYFIGIAEGRGITVNVSKDSALLSANQLYGFDERQQSILEYRRDAITTQIKEGANAEKSSYCWNV